MAQETAFEAARAEPKAQTQPRLFHFDAKGTCGITNGQGEAMVATDSLDPQSSPRRMKWLHGPKKEDWLCYYEFVGDTLKVVFVDSDTKPPTKLEPAKNLAIYYLRRAKQ